jgi:hypothetical protein
MFIGLLLILTYHVLYLVSADVFELNALYTVLHYPILFFVLFLFLSYEYFYSSKAVDMNEVVCAAKLGKRKLIFAKFLILLGFALLNFIVFVGFHSYFYYLDGVYNTEFQWHIIQVLALNYLLIPIVGIVGGLAVSLKFPRLPAYGVLTAFVIATSPMARNALGGTWLYNIHLWFSLYPLQGIGSINHSFGFSVLPYRWALMLFWLGIFGAIIMWQLHDKSRANRTVSVAVCCAISISSAVMFSQPMSVLDHEYHHSISHLQHYDDFEVRNISPAFVVTDMKLDLNIKNQLEAVVTIGVDRGDLTEYQFTLYHGYRIQNIFDQDGNTLEFLQEGDYIVIVPTNHVDSFRFDYEGFSHSFYSNSQGIYLSGSFPWYPRAGFFPLIGEFWEFTTINSHAPIEFRMTLQSPHQIYTNLEQSADGSFVGTTQGVIIYSGFLTEIEIDGIRVVYPYMALSSIPSEDEIRENVRELTQGTVFNINPIRHIFVVPVRPFASDTTYGDVLELRSILMLNYSYEMQYVLPQKYDLYFVSVFLYNEAPLEFESILMGELGEEACCDNQTLDCENTPEPIATFTTQAIESFGGERAFELINEYLFDNSDTRTVTEFFTQLLNLEGGE